MDLSTLVRQQFAPARHPGRVGVEVELIPVTDDVGPAPVPPGLLAAGFTPAFIAAARPTFEPGGQLELSPPPQRSVPALVRELQGLLRQAEEQAAAAGVQLVAAGTNPYHSCEQVGLCLPTPRYRALQRSLDVGGPDGRRMMRLTAALQVCVDLLPGRAGHEQWLVANLAGPPLTAVFANSPALAGRRTGLAGTRTRIWQGIDPRRTGYDGRHVDASDPVGAYTTFAAAAPRLPLAAALDPGVHLSTLFPPVRPRGGYLEIRYLDAQEPERIGGAVQVVTTLLTDPRARRDALDLLLPHAGDLQQAWRQAATGCMPIADALLTIAADAAPTAAEALTGGAR